MARLARRHDVLLVVDEVATGFGRTGTMFACEQAGVSPDLLCLSKGLTNGTLPFAVTLASDELYRSFLGSVESGRTFFHGHTFTANPLGCAIALASLEVFEEERTLANVAAVAPRLAAGIAPLASLPWVGDVRALGMVGAVELVRDPVSKEPLVDPALNARLHRRALEEGLYLRPLGNVVYLFLPQATTVDELDEILGAFRRTLEAVLRTWQP